MAKAAFLLVASVLGGLFPSMLQAQEIQEGAWSSTWSGPLRVLSEDVVFEVRRIPDPHGRWRPGSGQILTVTLLLPTELSRLSGGRPVLLTDMRLEGERLTYQIPMNPPARCRLTRQEDRSFSGECIRGDDLTADLFLTMIPPAR